MRRHMIVTSVVIYLISATCVFAGDPQAKLTRVAGNHEKYAQQALDPLEFAQVEPETMSMLAEIRAAMDSTRISERALREEFGSSQGPEMARRLGELKKSSRMRILQIQLKYAQKEGRAELERRIQASIEDLQRPAAPGDPRLNGGNSPTPVVGSAVTPAGGSQR
jgi:hypothetical protein